MLPLYDQLIEIARDKRRKRRCVSVHKSVSNPIVVLAVGDKQLGELDELYTQLTSRWSSQLNALQVCYCYVNAPYEGPHPILQAKLELPDGRGGPGALCGLTDALAAVNGMIGQAIDRISQEARVQMRQAGIHIVLAPEDPAGALLSDLAAVAKGRLEDFGVITNDCRLYLMLPKYQTVNECGYVCGVMDQLRNAGQYEQAVLQPQLDAAPRACRIERLINAVMLLDDLNENFQHYNVHGERLGLLVDLVENGWSNTGFIQTAGVQEGSAGPEYWLAQAADELCSERKAGDGRGEIGERFQRAVEEITAAALARSQGVEESLRMCCLFRCGQLGRVAAHPLDEGEEAVFGEALRAAYESWLEKLAKPKIPDEVLQIVKEIESDAGLDALIQQLDEWIVELEEEQVQAPAAPCPRLPSDMGEAEAARRFREILWTKKYQPMIKNEEQGWCAEMARLCVSLCRERKDELRSEEEEFAGFAGEIQEVRRVLRDAYDDGGWAETKWINKQPSSGALRRAGALAYRTGDPMEVLSMVAECVDLDGAANAPQAAPLLFCRILFAANLDPRVQPITQGVSAGCILKFAVISQDYDENAMRCVYALNYARENQESR